ncbi:MAG: hypothetical protein IPM97_09735 [Bdellovibrionaceae bacterium]|nr:hypothetical protein [Pseudobdellovibrionaceae bacterium]
MKKTIAVIATLSSMAVNANAANVTACFNAGNRKTGEIEMNEKFVRIDWDIKDKADSTVESGVMTEFNDKTPGVISGEVYLQGTGEGSSFRIAITGSAVFMQAVWSDGSVAGKVEKMNIKSCK